LLIVSRFVINMHQMVKKWAVGGSWACWLKLIVYIYKS